MGQKVVNVTVNRGVGINVSPNNGNVTIKAGDTVKWVGTGSDDFDIVLPSGEPSISKGSSGGKPERTSGAFQNNTTEPRTVKYDVTSSGTPTLDPEIDIQP
jgi:plastocyanin